MDDLRPIPPDLDVPAVTPVSPSAETGHQGLVSSVILGIGGIVYGILCAPAIGQRGFPPIDPVWTGVTFL